MTIKQVEVASVQLHDSDKEALYETINLLNGLLNTMDSYGYDSITCIREGTEHIYALSEAEEALKFLESITNITQIGEL